MVDDAGASRPTLLLLAGLALTLVCVGGGLWLTLTTDPAPWQAVDSAWLRQTAGSGTNGPALTAAEALAVIGGPADWVLVSLTAVVLLLLRRWASAGVVVAAYLITSWLTALLKTVFERPRPDEMLMSLESFAYPSGHSSFAAALLVSLIAVGSPQARRRLLIPVAIAGGVAMAWSRTYLAVHWLSDTVGGLALGTAIALMIWWALNPWLVRERGSASA